MIRTDLAAAFLAAAPAFAEAAGATAAPWAPLIGEWRTMDYASCGVDDVRAGRITSVGRTSFASGDLYCVIESGEAAGGVITFRADCDLGGGYMVTLDFRWRLVSANEAVLTRQGYDTRLVRCQKGLE